MTIANAEMAAAWDGEEGDRWADHAERYEATAEAHERLLLAAAALAPGHAVLDVGWQADAQVHPFPPATYDVAISSFGAMFFADPVAAFANIGRALQAGGRLGLLSWRELARNEWLVALRSALASGRDFPEPPTGVPGPFGLADADHVRRVLAEAGYRDVTCAEVEEPVNMGPDADAAFAFVGSMGITKGLTQDLDDAAREAALDALRRTLADHETAAGVRFGSSAWLVTATAGPPGSR